MFLSLQCNWRQYCVGVPLEGCFLCAGSRMATSKRLAASQIIQNIQAKEFKNQWTHIRLHCSEGSLVIAYRLCMLTELDQLLEDAPLPFIMQHAAKISSVRKRVSSLNSLLRSIQQRIDNMDRMLSAGIHHGNFISS
ncbi:hypothetical protein Patl1_05102 [Pistacia atlantica]|uniref:Uncharacterized protein n=1 Tax=Pistacia atlantica TaxID=434234 RepID=A0ACC1BV74_9ROSI|nr:hypothetical protein Patl1_05102 [Pistacia atlantica]